MKVFSGVGKSASCWVNFIEVCIGSNGAGKSQKPAPFLACIVIFSLQSIRQEYAVKIFFAVVVPFHLRTYLERRSWPLVEGTLDSIDTKIEATTPTEGVGIFVRPKFVHKIRYSYRDRSYVVELSGDKVIAERLKLRVNPERPFEAYIDNKTWVFPILAISTGIILVLLLIKFGADGPNE